MRSDGRGPKYAIGRRSVDGDRQVENGAHGIEDAVVRWADWPELEDDDAALGALPAGLARSLRVWAGEYSAVAPMLLRAAMGALDSSTEVFDGVGRVTVLSKAWHGLREGSLAYIVETVDGSEMCFVRDDVTVDPATGDVVHVDFYSQVTATAGPRSAMLVADTDRTIADEVFTMGEYASFMVPAVGPIVAGAVHVFRSLIFGGGGNRPKPVRRLSAAEVLEKAAGAYISSRVNEFQALVKGSYKDYLTFDRQIEAARDEREERVALDNLHSAVDRILGSDSNKFAEAVLDGDSDYFRRGAMAWAFAKQFQLLLLRKASILDGRSYQVKNDPNDAHRNVSDSPRWPELANELLTTVNAVAERMDRLQADAAELASHVISPRERLEDRYVETNGEVVKDVVNVSYYFTDSRRPGEKLGQHFVTKHDSDDHAKEQTDKARQEYADRLLHDLHSDKYGLDSPHKLTQLRDTLVKMLWSTLENLELFIVPCALGWDSGDDLPALGSWPAARDEEAKLEARLDAGTVQWEFSERFGVAHPEVTSGYLAANSAVIGNLRAGQGVTVNLPPDSPRQSGKAYAVQVRCSVPDEMPGQFDARGRDLTVRWSDLPADHETSRTIMVPPTLHAAGEGSWITRTVTVPLEHHAGAQAITVEGHGEGWGPDIVEIRLAALDRFPGLA